MKMKLFKMDKALLSNTFFLYLLTFSTQLFNLATIPYLTRILGAVTYGKTGIAMAYMSYVTVIMDFGFLLSATQKVVEKHKDKHYIGKLIYSVTVSKLILGALLTFIFVIYVLTNHTMRGDFLFYMLYLAAYLINAFLPDFYYRGIEKMKVIAYRTLLVKFIFMCLIFLMVKNKNDDWKVPLITLTGNVLAIVVMYYDLWKNHQIRIHMAGFREIWGHVSETFPFFLSRISTTVYQALNTIILSFAYGNSAIIGYYTSADKIVTISKMGASPIADSLYPYMIREKNFRSVKKFLIIIMPLILCGALLLFLIAEPLCCFLFGADYAFAGDILRCLIPVMVVILPSYILSFPVMVPLGLSRHANRANVIGMAIQVTGLLVLCATGYFNVYSLCLLTSFTEVSVFLYRLVIVLHYGINRKRSRKKM